MFSKSAAFYDALYGWKDYWQEAAALRALIQPRQRSPGNALLDVACGTGAHLAQLGAHYRVEGLDLDENILSLARQRLPEVVFHRGDMADFDLGREYDVVTCLFSSIGYVKTVPRLRQTAANLARHLKPGGVLAVEPWLPPEAFTPGQPHALFVDQPGLKVCRMNVSAIDNGVSVLHFHYLVATPAGVEHFTERHELGLFTQAEYLAAFQLAGLSLEYDDRGLMGRGLYLGVKPAA
jgi:SAM-dependent methyltransferase